MTSRRWVLLAGLVVGLFALARGTMPYSLRTGRYVYQTFDCESPALRVTKPQYNSAGQEGQCWASSVNRAEQGGILLVLTVVGGALALMLVRAPSSP